MDTAATVTGGRTVVPARVIGEALGAKVGWDPLASYVTIDSGPQTSEPADQAKQQGTQPAGQTTRPTLQTSQTAPEQAARVAQFADDVIVAQGAKTAFRHAGKQKYQIKNLVFFVHI